MPLQSRIGLCDWPATPSLNNNRYAGLASGKHSTKCPEEYPPDAGGSEFAVALCEGSVTSNKAQHEATQGSKQRPTRRADAKVGKRGDGEGEGKRLTSFAICAGTAPEHQTKRSRTLSLSLSLSFPLVVPV